MPKIAVNVRSVLKLTLKKKRKSTKKKNQQSQLLIQTPRNHFAYPKGWALCFITYLYHNYNKIVNLCHLIIYPMWIFNYVYLLTTPL